MYFSAMGSNLENIKCYKTICTGMILKTLKLHKQVDLISYKCLILPFTRLEAAEVKKMKLKTHSRSLLSHNCVQTKGEHVTGSIFCCAILKIMTFLNCGIETSKSNILTIVVSDNHVGSYYKCYINYDPCNKRTY